MGEDSDTVLDELERQTGKSCALYSSYGFILRWLGPQPGKLPQERWHQHIWSQYVHALQQDMTPMPA